MTENVSFSFGENWQDFLKSVSREAVESARADLEEWFTRDGVHGRRVLDIGCGSGIHSLGFFTSGAAELVSFDLDPRSVGATRTLWENAGKPESWRVAQGSVLDEAFLESLGWGRFDVVYSWGVLHHTGAMWQSVEHASRMVRPGGRFLLALYAGKRTYQYDLALKQRYNAAGVWGKRRLIARQIAMIMLLRLRHGRNPLAWNQRKERGMDTYHDVVDWLGGLPYEVASEEEVVASFRKRRFVLEKIRTGEPNTVYLFSAPEQEPEDK